MEHYIQFDNGRVGPIDASVFPRWAGLTTFARLPQASEVSDPDIAIVGIPFDTGVSYRPGTRFGPNYIRQSSRLVRPYNPTTQTATFARAQIVDAGDILINPFSIEQALENIYAGIVPFHKKKIAVMALGGDHTISLPLLRAAHSRFGPLALIHIDAHLDTWDTYFGIDYTHGTSLRRANEEALLLPEKNAHIGIRGPLYSEQDLTADAGFGFATWTSSDVQRQGLDLCIQSIRERVSGCPVYLSVDIDSLDPAFAPGTGTPEPGGLTSRELLEILRSLEGLQIVAADLVEVSPPYDHAEITGLAAAAVVQEILGLLHVSDI